MKRSFITVKPHGRSGFTRVEALVVICVVTLLAAVIAPAILGTKTLPPKIHCLNNIRQVGLALHNFASSYEGGPLPHLVSPVDVSNKGGQTGTLPSGWPMTILPMLEQGELLKNIRKNSVLASGQSSEPMMEVGPGERISILGLTCLEDTDARKRPGGLSYVMNIGFLSRSLYHGDPQGLHRVGGLSWNDNGEADELEDVEISAATGVTWRPCDVFNPSLDYVGKGDGTSYTLLLTENLQAGSWWDTETTKLGFGLPLPDVNGRVTFGQGTFFESPSQPLNTMFDGGTLTSARAKDWTINSDLKAAAGTRPRPSSNHENSKHLGGVHIIMCDGSGRFMNQNIDPHVYARLLTPNGVAYGERKLQQSEF